MHAQATHKYLIQKKKVQPITKLRLNECARVSGAALAKQVLWKISNCVVYVSTAYYRRSIVNNTPARIPTTQIKGNNKLITKLKI
jgi:hypothetical protein